MPKYNIHIGNLSPEEPEENSTTESSESQKPSITQNVQQFGKHNYRFDEPVSGFRIGDDYYEDDTEN